MTKAQLTRTLTKI